MMSIIKAVVLFGVGQASAAKMLRVSPLLVASEVGSDPGQSFTEFIIKTAKDIQGHKVKNPSPCRVKGECSLCDCGKCGFTAFVFGRAFLAYKQKQYREDKIIIQELSHEDTRCLSLEDIKRYSRNEPFVPVKTFPNSFLSNQDDALLSFFKGLKPQKEERLFEVVLSYHTFLVNVIGNKCFFLQSWLDQFSIWSWLGIPESPEMSRENMLSHNFKGGKDEHEARRKSFEEFRNQYGAGNSFDLENIPLQEFIKGTFDNADPSIKYRSIQEFRKNVYVYEVPISRVVQKDAEGYRATYGHKEFTEYMKSAGSGKKQTFKL